MTQIHALNISPHSLDAVLVDGRARVGCVLTALPYLKDTSIVMLHDFTWRPFYNVVLDYFTVVARHNTLVVLRPTLEALAKPPSADVIRSKSPTVFKKLPQPSRDPNGQVHISNADAA